MLKSLFPHAEEYQRGFICVQSNNYTLREQGMGKGTYSNSKAPAISENGPKLAFLFLLGWYHQGTSFVHLIYVSFGNLIAHL